MSRLSRFWLLIFLVSVFSACFCAPAGAQTEESIRSFSSTNTIEPDGKLRVTERITYDFGANQRHGLLRHIPYRLDVEGNRDRIYPITNVSVKTDSPATSADVQTSTEGNSFVIRVGDEDRYITGTHTYQLTYLVHSALNAFSDHDELYWNITGSEWQVPIDSSEAVVSSPAPVMKVACFEGSTGSTTPCRKSTVDGNTARFTSGTLSPGEGLTVVASLPKGVVPEPAPAYARTVADGFALSPETEAGSVALLTAMIAGLVWLYRRYGRDRRFSGSAVDQAFGSSGGREELLGWKGGGSVPVLFTPPEGVRPGLVGTLLDEKAQPLDATATIIDLASRGYLTITEIPKTWFLGKVDWRLDRQAKDPNELLPYERTLLDALFADRGTSVELSDLKDQFAAHLEKVREQMYEEVVKRKWFAGNPEESRMLWGGAGIALVAAGAGATYLLARYTSWGLLGIPLVVGGLILLALSSKMPRRTAKGTAVLTQVRGFRRFMDEGEKHRSEFEERHNLFTEYLPYAVVFGVTRKWAEAFQGLNGELPQPYWYRGQGVFTVGSFDSSINNFSSVASSTLDSTPSGSGSSGFGGGGGAGGGGGGGGGGSW